MLCLQVAAWSAAVRAQGGVSPRPGVRVGQAGAQDQDVFVDEAVRRMQDKVVRAIQIAKAEGRGEPRVLDGAASDPLVRSLLCRVGQPFESRKVSTDCMNFWNERRLIVSAYARQVDDEVEVTFVVEQEVETFVGVEFRGLDHLDRATVDSLLGIDADRQVTATEASAMRKVLLARYARDGFAFCSISTKELTAEGVLPGAQATGGRPPRRLQFQIDEGPKVTIRSVSFHGNHSFPSAPSLGLFGGEGYLARDSHIESDPAWGFVRGAAYSREILEEDIDRLRLFYRSRGFLDAKVDLADVQFTPDRTEVDVSFVVVEGPRYRIKSVRIQHVEGPARSPVTSPPRYAAEEIQKELKVVAGDFYDFGRLQRDWLSIQEFYGRRGHPASSFPGMANVPKPNVVYWPARETYREGPEVDITFQVDEGLPKRLRDVVIRGNRFTRDKVIRRRVRVLPGERIDMLEVNRTLRSLEQTRFFQDPVTFRGPRVQLEPVPPGPGADDLVDLGIDVEEGPTGELRWGIGISTGQGAQASITYNKRNFDLWNPPSSANPITGIGEVLDNTAFHGGGQTLGLLLAPGSRDSQFRLSWTEPDVFNEHIDTHELRVSGQRLIRRLSDGYTSDVLGAELGLSRNFTDEFNAGVSGRIDSVEIKDLAPDATSVAYDAEGQTELRGLRFSARYRDFDDLRRPSSGVDLGASVEMVGGFLGGEESLVKFQHTAHVYLPIAENQMGHRTVLHLEHFFGVADEFGGSDDVFLTERFYMGGANLRGFDFRRAGPSQFGRPVGGEATYTATAEIYFPLVATRMENEVRDRELLRGVVFTDIGLLGLAIDDPTFGELRGSIGIGLRIEVPYLELPIALDLGWPWAYEETDDRRQFYFSISR